MSTRSLHLTDSNLPPRKRQRNLIGSHHDDNNNSFRNDSVDLKFQSNKTDENENENNYNIKFKNENSPKQNEKNVNNYNLTKGEIKNELKGNPNNYFDDSKQNIKPSSLDSKIDLYNNLNDNDDKFSDDVLNLNSDDQIDIIGNNTEDELQSEDQTDSEDEFQESEKEVGIFDEVTKEKMRIEAHEIGFENFMKKYGHYSARSLISIFNIELPSQLDSYKNFELIPLLKIIMLRFNRRRQKLKFINTIDDAIELLKKSNNIIVLSGAGVSVSCGIPDFRSENGIYSRLDEFELEEPQQMFDLDYFKVCPETFYSFAHEIYPSNFKPSASHKFIKLLEDKGKLLRNYTQNIDTLEQEAGITKIVQCHGSFATASCIKCGYKVPGSYIEKAIFDRTIPPCPVCPESSDAILKPDIVFFGEKLPDEFAKFFQKDREKCDLLIVMGSSLKVSPVADIIAKIPHNIPQILINLESLTHVPPFDIQLLGYSDSIVKELCRRCDWKLDDVENTNEKLKYTLIKPSIHLFEGAKYNESKPSKISLLSALFAGIDSDSESDDNYDNGEKNKIDPSKESNTNSVENETVINPNEHKNEENLTTTNNSIHIATNYDESNKKDCKDNTNDFNKEESNSITDLETTSSTISPMTNTTSNNSNVTPPISNLDDYSSSSNSNNTKCVDTNTNTMKHDSKISNSESNNNKDIQV